MPELVTAFKFERDADVRDIALQELLAIAPQAAASLAPLLRRSLRSKDFWGPVMPMWALARLRDSESLPLIKTLEGDRRPFVQATARVVALILEGRDGELLEAIRGRDHLHMPWLAHGASILGTAEAIDALSEWATSAPDAECRRECEEALRSIRDATRSAPRAD